MFRVHVSQMVVFDPTGNAKGVAGFLGNHAQDLYPAFEGSLHVLSMGIVGWDFDRTNQPFAFHQLDSHQAEEATTAQIASDTLDRLGAGPVAKHQHRPMQPGPDSFASFHASRAPGDAVGKAAPGGYKFEGITRHSTRY